MIAQPVSSVYQISYPTDTQVMIKVRTNFVLRQTKYLIS